MYKYLIILLLISSFTFAESPNEEYIFINGTIKYIPLEGGFYGIIADDGKKYDPINLDQNFATDGLKVKVQAKILKDVVSFHMWGEIIKIIKIEPSSPQSKGDVLDNPPVQPLKHSPSKSTYLPIDNSCP